MSQENVESIERGYEALSRMDPEAVMAVCEPDIEFRSRIGEAEDVTYHGHDGVRDWMASLSQAFEWLQAEPLEIIDGGDWAVVCNRMRARGRRSEVEVEDHFFHAIGLRNGKAQWWAFYPSRAEALEAVGGEGVGVSRENVQVVRDALHAFAERGLAAMTDFWAADINWRAIEGAPDDVGEMHGAEALRHYFQDWIDTFDDISNVPEELLDLGDDRVLAVQHTTGRAKASGVETELRYAVVYTVRDGKIARGREYIDRATALEAVGLSETAPQGARILRRRLSSPAATARSEGRKP